MGLLLPDPVAPVTIRLLPLLLALWATACGPPSERPGELLNRAIVAQDSVEVKRLIASGISVETSGRGELAFPPLVGSVEAS